MRTYTETQNTTGGITVTIRTYHDTGESYVKVDEGFARSIGFNGIDDFQTNAHFLRNYDWIAVRLLTEALNLLEQPAS